MAKDLPDSGGPLKGGIAAGTRVQPQHLQMLLLLSLSYPAEPSAEGRKVRPQALLNHHVRRTSHEGTQTISLTLTQPMT